MRIECLTKFLIVNLEISIAQSSCLHYLLPPPLLDKWSVLGILQKRFPQQFNTLGKSFLLRAIRCTCACFITLLGRELRSSGSEYHSSVIPHPLQRQEGQFSSRSYSELVYLQLSSRGTSRRDSPFYAFCYSHCFCFLYLHQFGRNVAYRQGHGNRQRYGLQANSVYTFWAFVILRSNQQP
jgi:hypothetical protein